MQVVHRLVLSSNTPTSTRFKDSAIHCIRVSWRVPKLGAANGAEPATYVVEKRKAAHRAGEVTFGGGSGARRAAEVPRGAPTPTSCAGDHRHATAGNRRDAAHRGPSSGRRPSSRAWTISPSRERDCGANKHPKPRGRGALVNEKLRHDAMDEGPMLRAGFASQ